MGRVSMMNTRRSTFTPLFLTALLSSGDAQTSSADLWGNVKLKNSTCNDWKPVPDYDHAKADGAL